MELNIEEKQICEEILRTKLPEFRSSVGNIPKILAYCYSNGILSDEDFQVINNDFTCPTTGAKWDKISENFVRKGIKIDQLQSIFKYSENEHLLSNCGIHPTVSSIVKFKSWNMPSRNETFAGRADLLKKIVKKFTLDLSTSKRMEKLHHSNYNIVLYGMGGTGKSTLALQFLYENMNKFKYIFWLNAENKEILNSQLLELANNLGLSKVTNSENCQLYVDFTKILNMVKNFISEASYQNWITVYDNAQNYKDIKDIVLNFGGYVLITSRDSNIWPNAPKENLIQISGFEIVDCEIFVSNILGKVSGNEIKSLANGLANHPLALYHACHYIREYQITISEYLSHFNHGEMQVEFLDQKSHGEPKSINKSCSISLDKILEESKLAHQWLQICGNFICEKIPKIFLYEFLVCQGYTPSSIELQYLEIRKWILKFGLVHWNEVNETYSIHRMVHKVIRARNLNWDQVDEITFDILRNAIQRKAHRNLKESNIFNHAQHFLYYKLDTIPNNLLGIQDCVIFRNQNDKIVKLVNDLLNYLEEMEGLDARFKKYCLFAKEFIKEKSKLFQLYTTLGLCCNSRGDLTSSRKFYEKSLEFAESDSYSSADAQHCLANIHQICGEFEKAQICFKQSFQIQRNKYITNSQDEVDYNIHIGNLLNNFGLSNYEMGKYDEALSIFRNARNIFEKNDPDNVILGKILTNIGLIYYKRGIFHEALQYFNQAREIKIKNFSENHVSLLSTVNGIGNVQRSLGNIEKAIENYQKARNLAESHLNKNNPDLATIYINIADSYLEIGNLESAQDLYKKALKIFKEIFGPNCYKSSAIYLGLGNYYRKTNEMEKAMEFYEKSLSIVESFYGENATQMAQCLLSIGKILLEKEDMGNSSKYLVKSEKILIDNYGIDHVETAGVYYMNGVFNFKNGEFSQALYYFKKSLEIQEKAYGPYHIYTAESLNSIGIIYGKVNSSQKQLNYFEKCLEIKELHYGQHDEELVGILLNIGGVYRQNGEFDKCLEIYERAKSIEWKNVKVRHIFMGNAYNNIGDIYELKGNFEKALEYYSEALNIYNENYGVGHYQGNFILVELGMVYEKMGNLFMAYEYFEKALKIFENNEDDRKKVNEHFHYCKGKFYQNLGNFEKAIQNFEVCLNIIIEQEGEESISLLTYLWDLVHNHTNYKRKKKCIKGYLERIHRIETKYFQNPSGKTEEYIHCILARNTKFSMFWDFVRTFPLLGVFIGLLAFFLVCGFFVVFEFFGVF